MRTISIATSWDDLNDWQLPEIAELFLQATPGTFDKSYTKMLSVLFQKQKGFFARLKMWRIFNRFPISSLGEFGEFLIQKTDYYRFPQIKGLIAPTYRIGNITSAQFSAIDTFYIQWTENPNKSTLNRLVASLYRVKEDWDSLDFEKVGKLIKDIPEKQKSVIALAYKFTRLSIQDDYPVVFPKPTIPSEKPLAPVFRSNTKSHIPFDKVIIGLAMDEKQPLGKKQDVNKTRIYEFLNVLSESILQHQEKAKLNANK